MLRREGLYSAHLENWLTQRKRGELGGGKRGRKSDPQSALLIYSIVLFPRAIFGESVDMGNPMSSLTSIVVLLSNPKTATLPAHVGRAVYAEVLAQLERVEPGLAHEIHNGSSSKPLTCSSLLYAMHKDDHLLVEEGGTYCIRITGLTAPVSNALHRALIDFPPSDWLIDGHSFRVTRAVCTSDEHLLASTTTYKAIVEGRTIYGGTLASTIRLRFLSPTGFKSHKKIQVTLPLSSFVFGSLVDRWNVFGPAKLDPQLRQFCDEYVVVKRYDIRSIKVSQKNEAFRIGCVGRVEYEVLKSNYADTKYWLAALHFLADYALYSGVGFQTTSGMGQVRRL